MLIPVMHACSRLREVALAHPHLWTTLQGPRKGLKLPLIRQMAEWSKPILLKAVGSDIGILGEFPSTRFVSIHLYDIDHHGLRCLQSLLDQWCSPTLDSFSLTLNGTDDWVLEDDTLSLTPECAPNLRELTIEDAQVLVGKGLPNLTYLALIDTSAHNFHAMFIRFIGECPRLESIFLSGHLTFNIEEEDVRSNPPFLPLHHLRHITFHRFFPDALEYYVPLLQPRGKVSSFHVLAYGAEDPTFPPSFLLPPHPDGPERPAQKWICIGVHPVNPVDPGYAISLTTVTTSSTRRIAAWDDELTVNDVLPHEWPSLVLSRCLTSPSPLVADEVWLYGVGATIFPRPPLAHFFGATRVVLALDRRLHYLDQPSLHVLPSTRDPSFAPISITSVRIVHGFSSGHNKFTSSYGPSAGSDSGYEFDSDPKADADISRFTLSLGVLIDHLRCGGYGYIKHFVLQVTPQMHVDETELAEVEEAGRSETFAFECIEEFPEMPGHEDPARWGCRRYPGSLW